MFTKRRNFSRQAENVPYIQWLQSDFEDDIEDGDEDNLSSEYDDDEFSNESEGEVEGSREKNESQDQAWDNDDSQDCSHQSNVRLFMKGMIGDEKSLPYIDQVEVVARLCEAASLRESMEETSLGQNRKHVALLDDRIISGDRFGAKDGHCRPYLGPLTAQQLRQELRKNVGNPYILC